MLTVIKGQVATIMFSFVDAKLIQNQGIQDNPF